MTIAMLLLIIALILFVLAAINISSPVNLTAAGLACFVGSVLAGGLAVG